MTNRFDAHELTRRLSIHLRGARAALSQRGRPPRELTGLPPPARALLRRIFEAGRGRLRAPAIGGAAIALELREIIAIYREPAPGPAGAFVLAINDWALEQLRRHPELLAA